MKNTLLLILVLFASSAAYSQNWTYNFSDTLKNKTFVVFDSLTDPHHFWNIYSDTTTGQYWLGFEADSTMHHDSIRASVVLKFVQEQSVFSTVTIQHSYAFGGSNSGGFVEDNPIFNGGKWTKIVGNGHYFPHDIWINGGPTTDSSDFQNSGSLSSEYRYQCYAVKTDAYSDAIRFTVYDNDTTPHSTSWKIYSLNAVSHPGICSGINTISDLTRIQVVPNPCNGKITIVNNSEYQLGSENVLIFSDLTGKEVLRFNNVNTDIVNDISLLSSGMYLVQLQNGAGSEIWHSKIIKE
jgi:hypothetical protein